MINTVNISDMETVLEIIGEQKLDNKIDRYRSSYLYRGLPDCSFKLVTGLQRYCKEKKDDVEKAMLRNFAKYAIIDDSQLGESVWRQLILGQHHGLPTRLLDWTYSPLIGLHFATSGEDLEKMNQHHCVLWKIDLEELNNLLPIVYKHKLEEESAYFFTIEMLNHVAKDLTKYDHDMEKNSMVLFEPPSIDQRIISQFSYFTIVPRQIDDIEKFLDEKTSHTVKYVIDKDLRWRIRDFLDQMNVNERVVFPGLDGLSKWLQRHYFVK